MEVKVKLVNEFNLVVSKGFGVYEHFHVHTDCYTHIHKHKHTHRLLYTSSYTHIHSYTQTHTVTHVRTYTHPHVRTHIYVPQVLAGLHLVPLRALGMRLMLLCGVLKTWNTIALK